MTDVFIRCWPQSTMRAFLARAVVARCEMFECARVWLIEAGEALGRSRMAVIGSEDFARRSRTVADEIASGPYVILDDDHLPIGKTWLEDGMAALEAHPEFVMLSSWSINGEVIPSEAERQSPVFERDSSGTPCFVRKGTFVDLPAGDAPDYDIILSHWLKRSGRIGFLTNVRHNHLGCGYSQVIPEHWGA